MSIFKKNAPGFSTLEVLIALAVITISLSSGILVVFGIQALIKSSEMSGQALLRTHDVLSAALALSPGSELTESTNQFGDFEVKLGVQNINSYTRQISGYAEWQASGRRNSNVSLAGLATDWANALAQFGCSPGRGFTQPVLINFPFDYGPISDVKVQNQKLYVALTSTSLKTQPTFFIFNIASSTNPVLEGSLDNATGTVSGISAVAVSDNYAYIAGARTISASGSFGQLQIVDVSEPTNPKLITTYKISAVSGTSGQGVGNSIFYSQGRVYLGLTKTGSGPEFNVIDVRDVYHPVLAGSFILGNTVNSIIVKNNYAYLAHPTDSGSGFQEQLTVLDISDPAHIARIFGYHAPDNQGNGKSLFLDGSNLYFGRTVTNTANPELSVLTSSNLSPLGAVKISNSVNSMMLIGFSLFVLTNSQLKILDVSDAAHIIVVATPQVLPGGAAGTSLSCIGSTIYWASSSVSAGFLSILTPG